MMNRDLDIFFGNKHCLLVPVLSHRRFRGLPL